MFGVGLTEMVVIAFVAVLVLGPDKLPQLAKQSAQMLRRVRDLATNARDELRTELGPEYADLELRDLDPREIVRRHVREALAEEQQPPRRTGPGLAEGELPPWDDEAT